MPKRIDQQRATDVSRRNILLAGTTMAAASALAASAPVQTAQAQQQRPAAIPSGQRPNILVIFGDDIGQTNISAYSFGLMGYKTPNIDRVAREGMMFTDYYAEQSCTAGRSSFITGQCTLRTGLSKVGIPGAKACKPRPRRMRSFSRITVTPRASSARTIWATATSSCRRYTASTNSHLLEAVAIPGAAQLRALS